MKIYKISLVYLYQLMNIWLMMEMIKHLSIIKLRQTNLNFREMYVWLYIRGILSEFLSRSSTGNSFFSGGWTSKKHFHIKHRCKELICLANFIQNLQSILSIDGNANEIGASLIQGECHIF